MLATNLLRALKESSHQFSKLPALIYRDNVTTYGEFWQAVEQMAELLRNKLPGERCLFVSRNSSDSVLAFYALLRAGIMPFLADPAWTSADCRRIGAGYGISCILYDVEPGLDSIELISPVDGKNLFFSIFEQDSPVDMPSDAAFVRFTSGSTGRPRALAFSEAAAIAAAQGWSKAIGFDSHSRILCLASLNNGLAFNTSLLPLFLAGGALIFHSGPLTPSAIVSTVKAANPNVLIAFPFIFELMASRPALLNELKGRLALAISSAAPLSPAVIATWQQGTQVPIVNYYGIAELGPVTFGIPSVAGSVGRAIQGVNIRVIDSTGSINPPGERGRIAVSSPSRAIGYLDSNDAPLTDAFDEHGFFISKDLGALDTQGNLFLHGRMGAVINIAGQKIDPHEIENTIRELSGVRQVLVRGEQGKNRLYLVAHVESDDLTADHIREHCAARLPLSRIPQVINIHIQLPRSASGKVLACAFN